MSPLTFLFLSCCHYLTIKNEGILMQRWYFYIQMLSVHNPWNPSIDHVPHWLVSPPLLLLSFNSFYTGFCKELVCSMFQCCELIKWNENECNCTVFPKHIVTIADDDGINIKKNVCVCQAFIIVKVIYSVIFVHWHVLPY